MSNRFPDDDGEREEVDYETGLSDDDYRSYDLDKEEFNPDDFECDYWER